jgi:hypothetical protein
VKNALTRALAIDGNHAEALAVLSFVHGLYERNWREAEATSTRLGELVRLSSSRYVRPTYLAVVHAALGDIDRAFAALECAVDEHDMHATSIVADPTLESLREDRRFPRIMRRLGLDPRRLSGVRFSGSVEGERPVNS